MSTTKPIAEAGWTKEWPKVTGYYWRRINEHNYPSLVRIVGDTCRFSDGSSEGRYECYEFAGPLSPSDFEQLIQLRSVALNALIWMDWWKDPTVTAYPDGLPPMSEIITALREALTPTGEKS